MIEFERILRTELSILFDSIKIEYIGNDLKVFAILCGCYEAEMIYPKFTEMYNDINMDFKSFSLDIENDLIEVIKSSIKTEYR